MAFEKRQPHALLVVHVCTNPTVINNRAALCCLKGTSCPVQKLFSLYCTAQHLEDIEDTARDVFGQGLCLENKLLSDLKRQESPDFTT